MVIRRHGQPWRRFCFSAFGAVVFDLKIAQPFMAGEKRGHILPSPVRDGRRFLSSLTGLEMFPNREPNHEWLGYFQSQDLCAAGAVSMRGSRRAFFVRCPHRARCVMAILPMPINTSHAGPGNLCICTITSSNAVRKYFASASVMMSGGSNFTTSTLWPATCVMM